MALRWSAFIPDIGPYRHITPLARGYPNLFKKLFAPAEQYVYRKDSTPLALQRSAMFTNLSVLKKINMLPKTLHTLRSGITNNLDRREKEHQRNYGKDVHVQQVGNRTTREGAREWEKKQRRGTS